MPLTVTSTWRAPARTAASEFATARPEVVVAVRGERQAGHVVAQAAEDRAQLVRQRVADGVGHVEDGRARLVDGLRDLAQEGVLRAGRVLGRELDVVGRRPRAKRTASAAWRSACAGRILSLCSRWIADVARKT